MRVFLPGRRLLAATLGAAVTHALLAGAAPAAPRVNAHVERRPGGGVEVSVVAHVTASSQLVWDTLTDYDRLARFVPLLSSSRVVSGPGEPLRVSQEGVAAFLWYRFPIRVTYEIDGDAPRLLRFRGVAGNLLELEGEYVIEQRGRAVRLTYRSRFRPEFEVPAHLGPAVMELMYRRQFAGIVAEIRRRADLEESGPGAAAAGRGP